MMMMMMRAVKASVDVRQATTWSVRVRSTMSRIRLNSRPAVCCRSVWPRVSVSVTLLTDNSSCCHAHWLTTPTRSHAVTTHQSTSSSSSSWAPSAITVDITGAARSTPQIKLDIFYAITAAQTVCAVRKKLNLTRMAFVERIYFRQRCFDASKPRRPITMSVGFSRRNKILRCSAYDR